jgi:hypothetical protein
MEDREIRGKRKDEHLLLAQHLPVEIDAYRGTAGSAQSDQKVEEVFSPSSL